MDQKTETIITQLKNALERQEPGTNDHQWIMGISINDDRKQCVIVRVVLKTNELTKRCLSLNLFNLTY